MTQTNWMDLFNYTDLLALPNKDKVAAFDRIAKSFIATDDLGKLESEIGEILKSYLGKEKSPHDTL